MARRKGRLRPHRRKRNAPARSCRERRPAARTGAIKFVALTVSFFALAMPAPADPSMSTVESVVDSLNGAFDGNGKCSALDRSKTVMCVVNTSPREADKFVRGIVFTVNSMNVDMGGWKATVVTFDDYVVSLPF